MRSFRLPLVLAVLVGACSTEEPLGPPGSLQAIRVSIDVPEAVTPGSPAQVAVTLTNTLPRTIELGMCPTSFWVEDPETGTVVGGQRGGGACVAGISAYLPVRFAPYESKTLNQTWRATETAAVEPGRYVAYGWHGWVESGMPARVSSPDTVDVAAPLLD